MNKQALLQMWDHVRQVNGVGLRLIELVPDAKLDAAVIPGMRTPKQLAVHMYGQVVRGIAEGALRGEITDEYEKSEQQTAAGLKTKADLLNYCRQCWDAADRATRAMTDERLMAITKTPWGMSFPGFVAYTIMSDEYIHHRGQLYAYVRTLGIQPPHLWHFNENAEAFRPGVTASA
jgi:uncharacterized damage-inducible protein DinB